MSKILSSQEVEEYMNEIDNADFYIGRDTDKAINMYIELWGKLPEPKHNQPEPTAIRLLNGIYQIYFRNGDYINAKKWAIIALDSDRVNEEGSISTGEFFNMGMVCYELGEYDESLKYFDFAYQRGKKRTFQGEEKKYWEFYRDKKKIKK